MNVLTVKEGYGTVTRIPVPVQAIALEMERFFRETAGLETNLEMNTDIDFEDSLEEERAKLYLNEWRNFGGLTLSIVA